GLREAGGEREQRLAGAGGAEQGDEVDSRIQQQVESEVLLAVAGVDAPDRFGRLAVVNQRLDPGGVVLDAADDALEAAGRLDDALIDVPVARRQRQPVADMLPQRFL